MIKNNLVVAAIIDLRETLSVLPAVVQEELWDPQASLDCARGQSQEHLIHRVAPEEASGEADPGTQGRDEKQIVREASPIPKVGKKPTFGPGVLVSKRELRAPPLLSDSDPLVQKN